MLLALHFFHTKRIIHRDIKLENILINQIEEESFDIRVADFGLAVFATDNDSNLSRCGTPGYVAPEILRNLPYDNKVDIFSLGCVFYNLLTGKYLFKQGSSLS